MTTPHSSTPFDDRHVARRTYAPASSLPNDGIWRRPLVMIIDDSLAVRRVVAAVCARAGVDAIAFPDGLSAINALADGEAAVPDVLVLDIGLPKMDGYEVARILRSNPGFQATRIIMLTCRDGVVDRVRSKLVGANDFVAKPFRSAELLRHVQASLGSEQDAGGAV